MVNIDTLLPQLQERVESLSGDLLRRVESDPVTSDGLKVAHNRITKGGRTSDAFKIWLADYLDQVAVAWVLSCVFVRFMEDNGLIDECYLAGEGQRRTKAENEHELYFREHPHDSDREYFQHVFRSLGKYPACTELFAEGKTPLWAVGPSGDAAMSLLDFWREIDPETGKLKRSFVVDRFDARFLGDLYQELSERAQERFALLQTPDFIEQFILDRTLTPAIEAFGLKHVKLIDPTCGSGHFLLGAFERLFDLWMKREDNSIVAAQKALDAVWGVDINPFAVAIARFRLVVRALNACGIRQLKRAPAWRLNLAIGDSLLFGSRWDREGQLIAEQKWLGENEEWAPEIYACEDRAAVTEALTQQYHVVVGNPPYITAKDKAANTAYRDRFKTAFKKFHLSTPFTERFFELAVHSSQENAQGGFVGLIKDNAFMKRDFGKKLITDFLPKVDLTHVIDTSGAYIPGHGTPTVIMLGRNRPPVSESIRAVLGIKGEPSTPNDPAKGHVWCDILCNVDTANAEGEFVITSDLNRKKLKKHPWTISGGKLFDSISEFTKTKLIDCVNVVGIFGMTNADDVFWADEDSFRRNGVEAALVKQLQIGDEIRDWASTVGNFSLFPYAANGELIDIHEFPNALRWMWPAQVALGNRVTFNKASYFQENLPWWKWHQVSIERIKIPRTISLAFVATHNHFVLDSGGKVFNRSAPIIKLDKDATENDHLELLGLLNSSVAGFWMKQVFFPKGGDHVGTRGARVRRTWWDERYEFATTQLKNFPIPENRPLELAKKLHTEASTRASLLPALVQGDCVPTRAALTDAKRTWERSRRVLIGLQEELDWYCYWVYGITKDNLSYSGVDLPEVAFGERAFEIVMGQEIASGKLETAWFKRHNAEPSESVQAGWPAEYRKLVEKRIELIKSQKEVRTLEQPEYKRRWLEDEWEDQQQSALRLWLLRRLETDRYWGNAVTKSPLLQTTAMLSAIAADDTDIHEGAALYRGRSDFDIGELIAELVASESVPVLPALVFTSDGLRSFEVLEQAWIQQRQVTSNEDLSDIPNTPKFGTGDFQSKDYWRLRGKLNIAKERFFSFPSCERDGDQTLVIGWAGWDYVQRAAAIVSYYDVRKRDGWTAERLRPLLAALDQLLPWIHQWHPGIDPEYNETAGTSFQTLLESEAQELGLTLEDIRNWTPPKKTTKQKKKKS